MSQTREMYEHDFLATLSEGVKKLADLDDGAKDRESAERLEGEFNRTAKGILAAAFGAEISYAAFHYRASHLAEGRDSPAIFSLKTASNIPVEPPSGYDVNSWAAIILPSMLKTYLYIFGRHISLSENWILRLEDDFRKGEKATNPFSNTETEDQSIYLCVDHDRPATERPEHTHSQPKHRLLRVPQPFYSYLTLDGLLTTQFLDAVGKVVTQNYNQERGKLGDAEFIALDGVGDYRKVESILSQQKTPFLSLCRRGIETALFHMTRESDSGKDERDQMRDSFSNFINHVCPSDSKAPEEDENRSLFLQVMQGACLFSRILGSCLRVTAFPGRRASDGDRGNVRTTVIGADDMPKLWAYDEGRDTRAERDYWSAITVYSEADESRPISDSMHALRLLSHTFAPERIGQNTTELAMSELTQKYGVDVSTLVANSSMVQERSGNSNHLITPSQCWPLVALVVTDALRNVVHEGKHASLNVAIGGDIEFRDILTPIYEIAYNHNQEPKISTSGAGQRALPEKEPKQVSKLFSVLFEPKERQQFQHQVQVFARRHFSFVQGRDRFICISIVESADSSNHVVRMRYIADLRQPHKGYAATDVFSRIARRSGATVARIDEGGRISVYAGGQAKPILRGNPLGAWTVPAMIERNPSDNKIELEHVKKLAKKLGEDRSNSFDEFDDFVDEILTPAIKSVSDDPSEGATILLVRSLGKHGVAGHPELFSMPDCPTKMKFASDEDCRYVARETLRQFMVQDGATVIDVSTGRIHSRVQLVGSPKRDGNGEDADLTSFMGKGKEDELAAWGTRHISALRFVVSMNQKYIPSKTDTEIEESGNALFDVLGIVISQDGPIQLLNSRAETPQELRKEVLIF